MMISVAITLSCALSLVGSHCGGGVMFCRGEELIDFCATFVACLPLVLYVSFHCDDISEG